MDTAVDDGVAIKLGRLHHRTVFRRGVDVGADARDRALSGRQTSDAEIGNLDGLPISGQQQILWLDVAVNDSAAVRMLEAGTNLLEIEHGPIDR